MPVITTPLGFVPPIVLQTDYASNKSVDPAGFEPAAFTLRT